ncbi:TPA: hypothetical protein IF217_004175, partial [Escherichia coli]|nr:hypothetical protein [Escherichia coli]HBC1316094.1 hypothetical protein [Escherichia coli]
MATQPTNLPVPSESPRDLKFNAGKIDEFVTSLVNTYVDRFGNEHYTIEGLRWLAQQAIAQYGWIPVGTFQAGATLTLPNQILKDTVDGEYYRWDGALPKVVPTGSTPSSAGGVGVGAWLSVGDSTFRALIASATGAQNVGNGQDTLNNFLYHTLNEFIGNEQQKLQLSVNATGTDGRRTWVYGVHTPASQAVVPDDVTIQNDGAITSSLSGTGTGVSADYVFNLGNNTKLIGGKVNNTAKAGVATIRNKSNVVIQDVKATGSVTANNPFAYALDFRDSNNITVRGCVLSGYSGALSMLQCEKVLLDGISMYDMQYHSSVEAGGYGFVFGGCNDVIVTNARFKAKDGDNGRHAVYISAANGQNTDVVVSNCLFDWRDKSDAFRGAAVNVRSSVRTVISGNIFDGTNCTGTTDTGTITNCDIIGNTIRAWIYDGQVTHYGINLGDDTGSFYVDGGAVSNNSVAIFPKTVTATGNVYGINLGGKNRQCIGNRIEVPLNSYPIRIPAGADNILIANNEDKASAAGGQAFILFDGACSNITAIGNRTRRALF